MGVGLVLTPLPTWTLGNLWKKAQEAENAIEHWRMRELCSGRRDTRLDGHDLALGPRSRRGAGICPDHNPHPSGHRTSFCAASSRGSG